MQTNPLCHFFSDNNFNADSWSVITFLKLLAAKDAFKLFNLVLFIILLNKLTNFKSGTIVDEGNKSDTNVICYLVSLASYYYD